ncbi:hypothetical protein [Maribacter sp. 2307UL18-2]|uniref:hypothetical protein n=1 Tax=Maribacter sp. 2307UL18-2 TaxID=3386274 RepID=UPI0039BC7A29
MRTSNRNYTIEYSGAIAGILSIVLYIASAAFSFLPDAVSRLFAFAFPLLWIISFMGLYRFLSEDYLGASLQTAFLFGVIGGAIACTFLVIQQGNLVWYEQVMQGTLSEEAKQLNKAILLGVDKVQTYMDIVFDIFISIAWILFGLNIARSPSFSPILGYLGSLIALGLLVFNLYTFPFPPADSGLLDLGPFLGLWALVFYVLFFLKVKAKRQHQ